MFMLGQKVLPPSFPNPAPNFTFQSFVNLTSFALSFLLVFRTNNGYGRWDEARKTFGQLINRTRDLIRQGCQTFPEDDEESKKALGRWIIASAVSMRIHLQPDPGVTLENTLGSVLKPEELALLTRSTHRPVTAIAATGRVIQEQPISPYMQQLMYQNLTAFHDILGGCERILRAPIPVSFTRHTGRFLAVWLTCLPFSLYATCGPWCIPVSAAVTAVLCGIEEIGVQCEEPFGILPLEVICKRISTDVNSTIEQDKEIRAMIRSGLRPAMQ